ncbi:MAG: F0F1 ATP synthase subunit B [Bacillota bacterium]
MSVLEKIVQAVEEAVNQALGINLLDMIIQITATLILVLIVKKFFWGRITDFLDKRKRYMDDELLNAQKANEEAEKLREEREKEFADLRKQSKEYLETAKNRGKDEKKRIVDEAKREANSLITNAQKEISAEQRKAKKELQKEVVSIASMMAEEVIKKKIDKDEFADLTIKNIESSEEL